MFTRTYPAALWHVRPFIAASALLTFGTAAIVGTYLAEAGGHRPGAVEGRTGGLRERRARPPLGPASAQLASQVFTNNVSVAIVAFVLGIFLCISTAYLLAQNGCAVGTIVAVFDEAGRQPQLSGLLIPHGMIELSGAIVAGGSGLRLGWTLVDPGDRRRARASMKRAAGRWRSSSAPQRCSSSPA